MDFTNFYNIKTENVGGWTPAPGAQLTAMQTVNPVMHLAARAGIKMFLFFFNYTKGKGFGKTSFSIY
jgi:hypothetical protein